MSPHFNQRWFWTFLLGITLLLLMFLSLKPETAGVAFEKLSLSRNANNTGPIQRTYLISVSDTVWPELRSYAEALPYTPLGRTRAFFFLQDQPRPDSLPWQQPALPPAWERYCVASFERGPQGEARFVAKP